MLGDGPVFAKATMPSPAADRRAPADRLPGLIRAMARAARSVLRRLPIDARGPAVEATSPCPLCGAAESRALFDEAVPGAGTRQLLRCAACDLVRLDPLPSPAEIPALYGEAYYGEGNAKFGQLTGVFVLAFRMARARALRLMGVRHGAILDVGCGAGTFLMLLQRLGYEAHGTELSESSARGARALVGTATIRIGPIRTCGFDKGQFAAITAWQVFEHLEDPRETLREFHRLLAPEGALVLSMPNIESWQARWAGTEWFHLDLPRHLLHWSPATITRLLEQEGFNVNRFSQHSLEQNPFGLLQSALQRLGQPRMGLYAMLRGPLDREDRQRLRRLPHYLAYLAAFPFAIALETLASFLRSGATFTVIARRRPEPVSRA